MNAEQETVTVRIVINGKPYTVACVSEEEKELKKAAVLLDRSISEARQNQSAALSDERLMMVTALNIAHQLHKEKKRCREKEKIITQRIHSASQHLDEKITETVGTANLGKIFGTTL